MKQPNLSPRDALLTKYNTARINLLVVLLFTLVNVALGLTGSGTYFLFSAFIPYFLVLTGMLNCGKMPDDWYEGGKDQDDFLGPSYLIAMVVIALVILSLYVVFWLLCKDQKSGWMVASLVLFALDTISFFALGGVSVESLIDIVFHAWVLYYLISGVVAAQKLKKLPPEEPVDDGTEGVDYFPATIRLGNGKETTHIAANYFRGREGVGGKLYFYQDRIIFKSHSLNIQTGNTTIRYAEMTATQPQKNLGISNGLIIMTADGVGHRFVIKHRDEVMAYINNQMVAFRNQTPEPELSWESEQQEPVWESESADVNDQMKE